MGTPGIELGVWGKYSITFPPTFVFGNLKDLGELKNALESGNRESHIIVIECNLLDLDHGVLL